MAGTQDIRRSDRRRVRPVEFWNFAKPEDTVNETIIYNESELSRCSVFKPFSCSYRKTPKRRLSSFQENKTKVPKTTEKNDDQSALPAQNSSRPTESLGKKRRLEYSEPLGKDNSQSQASNEDTTHPAKTSRKDTQQEVTGSSKDQPSLGDAEQTQSSRLADTNQKSRDKKPSQRDDDTTAVNGEDTEQSPDNGGKERKAKENSVHSDDSAASQKTRGRKRKRKIEELQQEDTESSETPGGEEARRNVPQTCTRESLEPTSKQEMAGVRVLPNNSSKQATSLLDNSREHQRSIQLARDTPSATKFNLTGRDVTQNITAFEQPSFQNVFSSTVLDAPGKSVFKVPRLPPLRRPPLAALKVSTVCLEPSMGTIPEEEEVEEQQQKKQEKEEQLRKRKKQEQEKQQRNELENQERQTDREEQNKEQEKNEEEEQVQQKKQKGKEGVDKVPVRGGGEQARGDGGDKGPATATDKTGASQTETPQERTSTAVPSQPQGQESRGHPAMEDTRTEASQRRSSRVRMKPLEFWNFEKVQVEKQKDGEVYIIHQKQDPVKLSIKSRTIDCSMASRSQLGLGVTLTNDLLGGTLRLPPKQKKKVKETSAASPNKRKRKISPIKAVRSEDNNIHPALSPSQGKRRADLKQVLARSPARTPAESPSKKKLFSPQDNFLDKPVDEGSTFRKRIKGGMVLVHIKKFKDMQFMVLEREAYRCYLAQGLQMKDQSIYTGYVFLERGQIVWNTTRKTTIYVIEGYGSAGCINGEPGTAYNLKPRDTLEFKNRLKLSVKKDGRCKLLKLHIVLGPHL